MNLKNRLKLPLCIVIFVFCLIGIAFYMYKINKKLNTIASSCSITNDNLKSSIDFPCDLKICSKAIGGRAEFFKMFPDINKIKSLEIAPWCTPVLTGKYVKYFDIFDKKNLIEIAIKQKLDITKIPEIHYTDPEGDMSSIKEKFELVFSAHNIEHQIDLVGHLNQIANLLENDGSFFILIPDKRFCFDHYIAATPLSEVLAVHWQKPHTHSLQTILSMRCETAHNDAEKHWQGESGEIAYESPDNEACFINAFKHYNDTNGNYIDAHKWRFTPESFYNIVEKLYKMKLQPLRVKKVFCTDQNTFEFFAILYKPANDNN